MTGEILQLVSQKCVLSSKRKMETIKYLSETDGYLGQVPLDGRILTTIGTEQRFS